jgi:hypothetical protein
VLQTFVREIKQVVPNSQKKIVRCIVYPLKPQGLRQCDMDNQGAEGNEWRMVSNLLGGPQQG